MRKFSIRSLKLAEGLDFGFSNEGTSKFDCLKCLKSLACGRLKSFGLSVAESKDRREMFPT